MKAKHGLAWIGVIVCILSWLVNTAAYAGAEKDTIKNNRGIYIEVLAGYNRYAIRDIANPNDDWNNWGNGIGDFAFAGALGYQCFQHLSLELGGIYTLDARARNPLSVDPTNDEIIRPRYGYFAGNLSVMMDERAFVFVKVGLGYQQINVSNGPFGKERLHNWGAMFGAGTAYYFTSSIFSTLQWMRFTSKIVDSVGYTTAPNIFLLGVGYKF